MLDRKLVKSVATETLLMMGKSIPVAGKGIELWQAVSAQRERAGNAERIAELEARLSRFERKQRSDDPPCCLFVGVGDALAPSDRDSPRYRHGYASRCLGATGRL